MRPRHLTSVAVAVLVALATAAGLAGSVPVAAASADATSAADPATDATTYIGAVFEQFLGRPASDADVERWRPTVQWGEPSALTGALAVSDEWAGTQVDELYQQILGREPDAGGHDHWVATIARGATLEEVAAFLYGSDEYYERHGATPASFVDAIYRQLLGRAADDDGRRYWTDQIEAGVARTTVATGFYGALESRRSRVTTTYRDILGREPDRGGRDYWVDRLPTAGDVALAAYLAASDEFFVRTTGHQPVHEPRALDTDFSPYATVGPVTLVHPAAQVERIGFHESGHDGSQQATPTAGATRPVTLETRNRGTGSRTAADIVVAPGTAIRAPVSGRVVRAGTYRLYCRYRDDYAVIEPDARPGLGGQDLPHRRRDGPGRPAGAGRRHGCGAGADDPAVRVAGRPAHGRTVVAARPRRGGRSVDPRPVVGQLLTAHLHRRRCNRPPVWCAHASQR